MSEWQPIETAPVGKIILTYDGKHINIAEKGFAGWYGVIDGEWPVDAGGEIIEIFPTHWMPPPGAAA